MAEPMPAVAGILQAAADSGRTRRAGAFFRVAKPEARVNWPWPPFGIVNIIAEQMITNPKHVQELYDKLPESKRKAIDARDGKRPTVPDQPRGRASFRLLAAAV